MYVELVMPTIGRQVDCRHQKDTCCNGMDYMHKTQHHFGFNSGHNWDGVCNNQFNKNQENSHFGFLQLLHLNSDFET